MGPIHSSNYFAEVKTDKEHKFTFPQKPVSMQTHSLYCLEDAMLFFISKQILHSREVLSL